HAARELELPTRLQGDRRYAPQEGDDGPSVVLALRRPPVLGRKLPEYALDAALARVRHRHACRFEQARLLDLGADAPCRPGLAGLGERDEKVIPPANRLEIAGLGRRHGGFRPLDAVAAEAVVPRSPGRGGQVVNCWSNYAARTGPVARGEAFAVFLRSKMRIRRTSRSSRNSAMAAPTKRGHRSSW